MGGLPGFCAVGGLTTRLVCRGGGPGGVGVGDSWFFLLKRKVFLARFDIRR